MLLDNISDGAMIYQINDYKRNDSDPEAGKQDDIRIKYTNSVLSSMFQSVSDQ